MTTLGTAITAAGFFLAAAYVAGKIIDALAKRGVGKDEARLAAIRHGLQSGELDADDIDAILSTFDAKKTLDGDLGFRES